jgi:hypothetical protein
MVACETSRDIIIQNAVRAGVEAKFFAEIQDIRCESRKNDKKDNEKKCFSFIKQNRSSHVQLSSRVCGETIRIKRLVKIFLASLLFTNFLALVLFPYKADIPSQSSQPFLWKAKNAI